MTRFVRVVRRYSPDTGQNYYVVQQKNPLLEGQWLAGEPFKEKKTATKAAERLVSYEMDSVEDVVAEYRSLL